ncbi:MAG: hypothetical protein JOZ18_00920 [Chloroflexi bacterium]|nr:hypothetical protein [Chloroflexota bacterium]
MASEVARLRAQIEAEYEAAHAALHGLASGCARHEVITARMERMSEYVSKLAALVGIEQAAALLAETLEGNDAAGQ